MPTPIIFDCDPGHDDTLALLLAARAPELKLLASPAWPATRPSKRRRSTPDA
jgi:inosine-uridine nucleoside N-ribohydrolase